MLYFRSCPRCKTGTVQLDFDLYGTYISCLNCGFEKSAASVRKLDFKEPAAAPAPLAEAEAVAVAAETDDDVADDDFEDDLYDDEEDEQLEEAAPLRRAAS
jgi:hypothetical protein